jgi:hypothetical protein
MQLVVTSQYGNRVDATTLKLAGVSLFFAVRRPSWCNLEQPLDNLVQPAVDIGGRRLIFRFVAAELEQPLDNLVQPAVDIGRRRLIFGFVAAELEQPGATWCNL